MPLARAYLVESIPTDLEDLRGTPDVEYTENVLKRLTERATSTIDVTAMYWNLLADRTTSDESGFTDEQFKAFGAGHGRMLYQALRGAATRGVRIRILQGPGFRSGIAESRTLQAERPSQVEVRDVRMSDWYGGGVMHQKLWVFDRQNVYLGSANMDWRSITQVKEMGVAVESCPELAGDITRYFDGWWTFSVIEPRATCAFDRGVGIWRKVPDWSELVPSAEREPSPLNNARYETRFNRLNPLHVEFSGQSAQVYVSGCPREVCPPGRTYDGEALVETILEAEESVCISVMDFAPVNVYPRNGDAGVDRHQSGSLLDTPVWWPDIVDALLHVVLTRRVDARLLVSKWAHTSLLMDPLLRALEQTAAAGRAGDALGTGRLEIRYFIVPGWASTMGTDRKYPGYTRVNHGKYIVTDKRLNIGTSNMTWDYFADTAGSSLNTDHPALVGSLQAVFNRDWNSRYAQPLAATS